MSASSGRCPKGRRVEAGVVLINNYSRAFLGTPFGRFQGLRVRVRVQQDVPNARA